MKRFLIRGKDLASPPLRTQQRFLSCVASRDRLFLLARAGDAGLSPPFDEAERQHRAFSSSRGIDERQTEFSRAEGKMFLSVVETVEPRDGRIRLKFRVRGIRGSAFDSTLSRIETKMSKRDKGSSACRAFVASTALHETLFEYSSIFVTRVEAPIELPLPSSDFSIIPLSFSNGHCFRFLFQVSESRSLDVETPFRE